MNNEKDNISNIRRADYNILNTIILVKYYNEDLPVYLQQQTQTRRIFSAHARYKFSVCADVIGVSHEREPNTQQWNQFTSCVLEVYYNFSLYYFIITLPRV